MYKTEASPATNGTGLGGKVPPWNNHKEARTVPDDSNTPSACDKTESQPTVQVCSLCGAPLVLIHESTGTVCGDCIGDEAHVSLVHIETPVSRASLPTEPGFYWRRVFYYGGEPEPGWRWAPAEVYRPYGEPDGPLMTNGHGLDVVHWGPRLVPPPEPLE